MLIPIRPIKEIFFNCWQDRTSERPPLAPCQHPETDDGHTPVLTDKSVDVVC